LMLVSCFFCFLMVTILRAGRGTGSQYRRFHPHAPKCVGSTVSRATSTRTTGSCAGRVWPRRRVAKMLYSQVVEGKCREEVGEERVCDVRVEQVRFIRPRCLALPLSPALSLSLLDTLPSTPCRTEESTPPESLAVTQQPWPTRRPKRPLPNPTPSRPSLAWRQS
jgi:hypothetical protein